MPKPTSSGVAGVEAFKAAGGALRSTILVILMTPPRTHREWAVLISTVVNGLGGGGIAVQYFRLLEWVDSVTGLVVLGGLIFGCGLSGWPIVRWVFNFSEQNRDAGVDDVAKGVGEVL